MMKAKTFETPCGTIHYWTGKSAACASPQLIFLPGLTADHRLFKKQIDHFEGKYPVFVWDAPGHAASWPFEFDFSLMDKAVWLDEILKKEDPEAALLIHPNNTRRVIRALAVKRASGVSFSEKNKKSKTAGPSFNFRAFMPDIDRAVLYDRINRRVDIMMEQGLEEEARMLYGIEKAKGTTCFQAIGYKEFGEYFAGNEDITETVYKIKLGSRHYAKRQLTWFRHMGDDIGKIPFGDAKTAAELILEQCRI